MVATMAYWFCVIAAYGCLLLLVGSLRSASRYSLQQSAWAISALGLLKAGSLANKALTDREHMQLAGCVILLLALAAHAWHTDRAERRRAQGDAGHDAPPEGARTIASKYPSDRGGV